MEDIYKGLAIIAKQKNDIEALSEKRNPLINSLFAYGFAESFTKNPWKNNLISSATIAVLRSISDFELYSKKVIEGKELAKRVTRNAVTGVACASSSVLGAKLGTMICPGVGTVVGTVLGMFAGFLAGYLAD